MAGPRRGGQRAHARAAGGARARLRGPARVALARGPGRGRRVRRHAARRAAGAGVREPVEPGARPRDLRASPRPRADDGAGRRAGLVPGARRRLPRRRVRGRPGRVEQPAAQPPRVGRRVALRARADRGSRVAHVIGTGGARDPAALGRRDRVPEAPPRRRRRPRARGLRRLGRDAPRLRPRPAPVPLCQRRRGVRLPARALRRRAGDRRARVGAARRRARPAPRARDRADHSRGPTAARRGRGAAAGPALVRRRSDPGQEAAEVQRDALGVDRARRPPGSTPPATTACASSTPPTLPGPRSSTPRTGARCAAPGRATCARTSPTRAGRRGLACGPRTRRRTARSSPGSVRPGASATNARDAAGAGWSSPPRGSRSSATRAAASRSSVSTSAPDRSRARSRTGPSTTSTGPRTSTADTRSSTDPVLRG